MGKNLIQQRRGKGSPTYRSPSHKYLGEVSYKDVSGVGVIKDIVHAPGRKTPLAIVNFNGKNKFIIPPMGISTGSKIEIKTLEQIPEGSKIYDIELRPGDGGKLCRSSGSFATLISVGERKSTIMLPSRKKKTVSNKCRAIIGIPAGSGRTEKPFIKGGTKYHAMRARGKLYPRTSGVSMNAVDHPFGGSTKTGIHKSVSRHAPPGKKVGSISPRRTGKRK